MSRNFGFLFMLSLLIVTLAACAPGGAEVEVTPEVTLVIETATPESIASTPTNAPTTQPTSTIEASETTTAAPATLAEFTDALQQAVAARDFAALQNYMADPFNVGYWLSEGVSYSPAEAADLLETSFMPEGSQIVWADPDMDLAPMLQGQPPASFLGPDKQVAAALLSYGWGEDGAAEAIQFITQQPDGTFRWELMLYSGFGFMGLPTDVEAVLISADEATFYSGPGDSYEVVATIFGGQTYPVIGVSQDQQWWRLRCYDDNNVLIAQCWVSADPAITTPTTLP
jgi:uncharacterized protein YgiM (DUF1202 family)